MKSIKQIAIYGKGGIGKSTTCSNISAALGLMGYRVLQIGCDPKADSTKTLVGKNRMSNILDYIKENSKNISIDSIVTKGFANTYCIEAGGPEPGIGCAGRGIISAIEIIEQLNLFKELDIEVVVYDVLGDVVCGGFAVPLRMGFAKDVYLITSGELMALYAANNIAKAINRFGKRSDVRLSGIICNQRNAYLEEDIVNTLSAKLSSQIIGWIPRDNIVQECELAEKTVMEGNPESRQAQVYRELARNILENNDRVIPTPLSDEEFDKMVKEPLTKDRA
ncbi:MAG: nitrogenase iron protein NifH [Oscillospiraceae bacterium]|nr:nitrogenase iron protein NifH [Oscillospiraceae bacterium]